jgi:hypothetical protein
MASISCSESRKSLLSASLLVNSTPPFGLAGWSRCQPIAEVVQGRAAPEGRTVPEHRKVGAGINQQIAAVPGMVRISVLAELGHWGLYPPDRTTKIRNLYASRC